MDKKIEATILVVDDEPDFCSLMKELLELRAGFNILTSTSPIEGMKIARKKKPDLILLDIVMPKMNGKELADEMLQLDSNLAVLFTSGYTDNHMVQNSILDKDVNFIHKPYSISALSKKMRSILDKIK